MRLAGAALAALAATAALGVAVTVREHALATAAGDTDDPTDDGQALSVMVAAAPAQHPDLVWLSPDGES